VKQKNINGPERWQKNSAVLSEKFWQGEKITDFS
jgi:hypothetical protein